MGRPGIIFPDGYPNESTQAPVARSAGFWRRQFDDEPTSLQTAFDVVFGILLPVICFLADPIVFKTWAGHEALMSRFTLFAYLQALFGVTMLGLHLVRRLPSPFLAGGLFVGAIFSLSVGIVLLPFSVLGLLFLIGALGFTPLLSGFVFLRNAARAWRRHPWPPQARIAAAGAALTVTLLGPAFVQTRADLLASTCMDSVVAGNASDRTIHILQVLRFTHPPDRNQWAYQRSRDRAFRARLRKAYIEITRMPIDTGSYRSRD